MRKFKEFKIKKHSLSYLDVFDRSGNPKRYYSIDAAAATQWELDQRHGIRKLEQLLSRIDGWQYAVLSSNETQQPIQYYHPAEGTRALSKEEYNILLGKQEKTYGIYLIPSAARRAAGETKGESIFGVKLNELKRYWSAALSRIDVYSGRNKVYEYKNGDLIKLGV